MPGNGGDMMLYNLQFYKVILHLLIVYRLYRLYVSLLTFGLIVEPFVHQTTEKFIFLAEKLQR